MLELQLTSSSTAPHLHAPTPTLVPPLGRQLWVVREESGHRVSDHKKNLDGAEIQKKTNLQNQALQITSREV